MAGAPGTCAAMRRMTSPWRESITAATSAPAASSVVTVVQASSLSVNTTARCPGSDAVAVDVGADRAGQHHAGPVVVAEDERPLDRAGGQHALARHDAPQALARRERQRSRQVIADPLDGAVGAVVVGAEDGGAAAAGGRSAGREFGVACATQSAAVNRRLSDNPTAAGRQDAKSSSARITRAPDRPRPAPPSGRPVRRRSPARRNGRRPSRRCPGSASSEACQGRRRGGSRARRPSPRTRRGHMKVL